MKGSLLGLPSSLPIVLYPFLWISLDRIYCRLRFYFELPSGMFAVVPVVGVLIVSHRGCSFQGY